VVENMSWFIPDDAPDKRYPIFGSGGGQLLADSIGVPLLAQLPMRQGIVENADAGKPVTLYADGLLSGSFIDLAKSLAQQIAIRNATRPPTSKVEMSPL